MRNISDIASGLITGLFNGSDPAGVDLVNTVSLPLENIERVDITYLAESIVFSYSENENLIIREYMNQNDNDLYAQVKQGNSYIEVTYGRRKGIQLRSRIEVDIPKSWKGTVKFITVYGSISSENDWKFNSFTANTTGGNIDLQYISAKKVKLASSTGTVRIRLPEDVNAEVDAKSQSGGIYSVFDEIKLLPKERGEQSNAHGFLGTAPYCDIEITTLTGEIHISK